MSDEELAHLRGLEIGFVFQTFNLVPRLTAFENVLLPTFANSRSTDPRKRATELLTLMGLQDRMHHRPGELSGGLSQRVSIARALINDPSILLADEPTGNLDPKNAWEIMRLLKDINRRGTTVLVATHAQELVDEMKQRVIQLDDGKVIRDEERGSYKNVR